MGRSIHRSQGTTEHGDYVIDMTGATARDSGSHYTALSRGVSLHKTHIAHLREEVMGPDPKVHNMYHTMRRSHQFIPSLPDLTTNPPSCPSLTFFNTRSLPLHHETLASDPDLMSAATLFLCETRMLDDNSPMFPTLTAHFPYCVRTRGAKHLSCTMLSKVPLSSTRSSVRHTFVALASQLTVSSYLNPILVVGIYRRHRRIKGQANFTTELVEWLQRLTSRHPGLPVVLGGDFNLHPDQITDLSSTLSRRLDLTPLPTGPTTTQGSTIDHMFVDRTLEPFIHNHGTLECLFSDHVPLYLTLKGEE